METSKQKYLYVETYGCQMNVSDSDKMAAMLKERGYASTDDVNRADLIIFNTCSVRAKAEDKVYAALAKLKPLKKARKKLIIGVGGCVAQQEGERLLERVPHLDLVFGTHNLVLLPELVRLAEMGERRVAVEFVDGETSERLFPMATNAEGISRFVTIMQGCDNYCSYCIVPHVRGREISRPSGEILREIRQFADRGGKEVTLLGQNVNSFGAKREGEVNFPALLEGIAAIDGIDRIRFTTSHPKDISKQLINCFAKLPKLCSHIHLPAQCGSDSILARMNRGYTRRDYIDKVNSLRQARPDIAITGDIIAGFPGETEADFEETLSLMEEVRYMDLFSFIYSPRPGTAAADFPGQLKYEEKQRRLDRIIKRQREVTFDHHLSLVGSVQEVLADGLSKRGDQVCGRTGGNRIVNFAADSSVIGTMVKVKITRALQNSLQGELAK